MSLYFLYSGNISFPFKSLTGLKTSHRLTIELKLFNIKEDFPDLKGWFSDGNTNKKTRLNTELSTISVTIGSKRLYLDCQV